MSDAAPAVVEKTSKERLEEINAQLKNVNATLVVCEEIVKSKNIRIVNGADTSDQPTYITMTGDAVVEVVRPIITGVGANRAQLISAKEAVLADLEAELAK
jgi:hypothetical protein